MSLPWAHCQSIPPVSPPTPLCFPFSQDVDPGYMASSFPNIQDLFDLGGTLSWDLASDDTQAHQGGNVIVLDT